MQLLFDSPFPTQCSSLQILLASVHNLWRCRICLWGAVTTATRARNTCNNAETVTEALIFVHLSLSTIKCSGNESSIITDTQFLHLCNLDLFWDNRSTFCCRVKKMVLNQNWENEYTVHSVDICILFSCSDWLLQCCMCRPRWHCRAAPNAPLRLLLQNAFF